MKKSKCCNHKCAGAKPVRTPKSKPATRSSSRRRRD